MTRPTLDDVVGAERIDSRDLIEVLDDDLSTFEAGDFILADAICALRDQGISEWEDGAQLIRENAFEDYARELAEDIGAIDASARWPNDCIDWKRAARELAYDYSCVSLLGYDYMFRS